MTNSNNQEKLKSFLFYELGDEERQTLEESFFGNDDLFYEVMELENELVDGYVNKTLSPADTQRFEKSLASSPERREKVANAKALQSFIIEEKQVATEVIVAPTVMAESVEENEGFLDKIKAFFTFQMPMMQYATVALLFLLTGGMAFLIYERIQLGNEMAEIKNNEQQRLEEIERREKQLQESLKKIEDRENELENQVDDNDGTNETQPDESQADNQAELKEIRDKKRKAEREQKRLKDEAEKLKKDKAKPPVQKKQLPQPPKPTLASITLLPFASGKGNPGGGAKSIKLDKNVTQLSTILQIPKTSTAKTYTVTFKGTTLASNVKVGAAKSITVRIPTKQLSKTGDNLIKVKPNKGRPINYVIRLQK